MYIKRFYFIIILITSYLFTYSQQETTLKDTVEVITIYEYDTIYVQSDTIRLTDTIVDIVKLPSEQKINPDFQNQKPFLPLIPNSIGLHAGIFYSQNIFNKNINDTLSSVQVVNFSISTHFNYYLKKNQLSFGLGFTPCQEKNIYNRSYYTSGSDLETGSNYDSSLVNTETIADYYCNYFIINTLFGRKWNINKSIRFSFNLGCSADFLVGYKQGNTTIPTTQVRKYDISAVVLPDLCFKLSKINELCFSLYYQLSLLNDQKIPFTNSGKLGFRLGLNFTAKKD